MPYKFIQGDPDKDFWEQNPELKYFNCTRQLIEQVGPLVGSSIMWAVYLTESPESKYYPMDLAERRNIIATNYLKIPDFDWDKYDYLIADFPDISMSKVQRWYKALVDAFDNAVYEIKKFDVKKEKEFNQFIQVFSKLETMFKGIDRVEAKYEAEKEKFKESRGQGQSGFFGKRGG